MRSGPQVPTIVAAGLICLCVGAAAGYYGRYFAESPGSRVSAGPSSGGMGSGGGMMGGPSGGMGGGMMGGGNQPQNGMALARTVRNLSMLEKAQNRGLSPQQATALTPVLDSLKSTETLPDKDAEAKLAEVNKILTDDQKKVLDEMAPPRGGFGGGGRGGAGGPGGRGPMMASGGPGGPGMMGGGMRSGGMGSGGMMGGGMGGGRPDPQKPFASERSKQALDDLLVAAKSKAGQK